MSKFVSHDAQVLRLLDAVMYTTLGILIPLLQKYDPSVGFGLRRVAPLVVVARELFALARRIDKWKDLAARRDIAPSCAKRYRVFRLAYAFCVNMDNPPDEITKPVFLEYHQSMTYLESHNAMSVLEIDRDVANSASSENGQYIVESLRRRDRFFREGGLSILTGIHPMVSVMSTLLDTTDQIPRFEKGKQPKVNLREWFMLYVGLAFIAFRESWERGAGGLVTLNICFGNGRFGPYVKNKSRMPHKWLCDDSDERNRGLATSIDQMKKWFLQTLLAAYDIQSFCDRIVSDGSLTTPTTCQRLASYLEELSKELHAPEFSGSPERREKAREALTSLRRELPGATEADIEAVAALL
ncbi:hypothetical protein TRVA0_027S00782 [Trichomonascus vanleenenianus]|uniref:uncharacterized protein n=1 Tax=Trichomonascus vanleenenianus TaxID=2268995 RepID=UPI003ECAC8B4